MKKNLHPEYHSDAKIICACGHAIQTGSVIKEMKVEICSACHPFYTGKKKSLDTTGRVDRFKKLAEKSQSKKVVRKSKTEKKATVKAKKEAKNKQ